MALAELNTQPARIRFEIGAYILFNMYFQLIKYELYTQLSITFEIGRIFSQLDTKRLPNYDLSRNNLKMLILD